MNNTYKIYKLEFNREIPVCMQHVEEPSLFKSIACSGSYKIYENDKDVTKKYKNYKGV